MSTTAAAVALTAAHWVICRLRRAASSRDRLIREAHERADSYEGPDSLRLMQDLDAHLTAYAAQIGGLYEQPAVAPDPVLAAGADRLRAAIRNDHTEEGQ